MIIGPATTWASYNNVDCYHALCNTLHLRKLIHAEEQHDQRWAGKMIDCLLDANAEGDAARAMGDSALAASRVTYK